MSKLPAIFFVATLLLAPRLAAADVPPSDMPADCSVASLNVPDGVKCVECVIQGSMRPECASDWAKQGYEGDFMSGDPASVGYAYMACTQSGSGPKVFTYQVWCDADLSTSGGCATRSPGRGFDAGIVGLLLATAAYVGWARRRRGSRG